MDRACLEYGVRAGLIFCLAREFPLELNEILVKKAVKYRSRGVVGIDLAGPESHTLELGAEVHGYRDLFARARAASLGTTVHTGETPYTGGARRPGGAEGAGAGAHRSRRGRGRERGGGPQAGGVGDGAGDLPELELAHARRRQPRRAGTALRTFENAGVRYTINTDGPYLLNTHLRSEYQLLLDAKILSESEAERSVAVAHAATFISRGGSGENPARA